MPRYERLQEDQRDKRRSIADVIEVLCSRLAFDATRTGKIRVAGLRLPSGQIVGLVATFVEGATDETIFIISLPTSAEFLAKRQSTGQFETFGIFQLDGATFDGRGAVELSDGVRLRAVAVMPSLLPYHVTKLEWRIIHHTIAFLGAESECYRYLIPLERQRDVLDCSALPALRDRIRGLKQIQGYITDRETALKGLSKQKIVDTLRKFGIRIPSARPRRHRAAPRS